MNGGNNTLNTAMAVMAGVATGNLISTAATASALSEALKSAQTDIASSGIDLSDLL